LLTCENTVQKTIFPFSIVKTEHLKEFGFDFALNPFMIADTKGVHELGGFMSPSANILCHLCEIRRPNLRNHLTTDLVVMRTIMTITTIDEAVESVNAPGGIQTLD
jgi:hypothetical protein